MMEYGQILRMAPLEWYTEERDTDSIADVLQSAVPLSSVYPEPVLLDVDGNSIDPGVGTLY